MEKHGGAVLIEFLMKKVFEWDQQNNGRKTPITDQNHNGLFLELSFWKITINVLGQLGFSLSLSLFFFRVCMCVCRSSQFFRYVFSAGGTDHIYPARVWDEDRPHLAPAFLGLPIGVPCLALWQAGEMQRVWRWPTRLRFQHGPKPGLFPCTSATVKVSTITTERIIRSYLIL